MSDLIFPPELEHKIFEMAFDPKDKSTSHQMILVSRRTRLWIRRLIYRIFDQRAVPTHHRNPFPNLKLRPPFVDLEEICQFAKHLALDATVFTNAELNNFVSQCPNLVDLACWGDLNPLDIRDSISGLLHLRKLSGSFRNITDADIQKLQTPTFASLTHLEILYPTSDWYLDVLSSSTKLTHVSIYLDLDEDDTDYPQLKATISRCAQIRIFLFSLLAHELPDKLTDLSNHDPRVVFIDCALNNTEDWHRGARGEPDIWYYAENMVYARKHGYFKSEDYRMDPISTDFHWLDHLTEEGKGWFLSL